MFNNKINWVKVMILYNMCCWFEADSQHYLVEDALLAVSI